MKTRNLCIIIVLTTISCGIVTEARSSSPYRKKSKFPVLPLAAGLGAGAIAGAAAVPLFDAASNFFHNPVGYPINITVTLADDGHESQIGKFEIKLHTLFFKQKVKLNGYHIQLTAGTSYYFMIYSEYQIQDIRYVELKWKKRSWTNLLGSWAIHVDSITLDPVYMSDPMARANNVRRLCARKRPFNLWHKEEADFEYPC